MSTKVKIPIAIFEFSADFKRPIIALWMDRAAIVQAILDALSTWKIDIDNIEPITIGKPSEQGIKIKLVDQHITFFFSPSALTFTKDNADWSTAEETIHILDTAVSTLLYASGAEISARKTTLAMHLQPLVGGFLDILKPFLSPTLGSLRSEKLMTGASIVKWTDGGRVVLDGSGALANAIYLRSERKWNLDMTYVDIAEKLRADEVALFSALDVEEQIL